MGGSFNRNILISRANIRKAKGQTAAIITLVILSSLMMNLWLMLSMDYKNNFERYHDKLNDGHVNIAAYTVGGEFNRFIEDTLDKNPDVTDYSINRAFCSPVSFQYNGGETSQLGVLLEKNDALARDVGEFEITDEGSPDSGIYLPMLYGMENNYSVGDTIELDIYDEKYEYTVCGFFNSTMAGSHNCGLYAFLLTEDKFLEYSKKSCAAESVYVSIRIKDRMRAEEMETSLKDAIAKEFPSVTVAGNNYTLVSTSRYISQMICAGIMSAMAFFVLLIGVVVIISNMADYIRENMQNLGAQKAIGYTSGQLISALIIQFSGISAAASVVGTVLSYCIFPAVNSLMIAQTGIPYKVKLLPVPIMITIMFISGVVALAVYLSAAKIKKIEPITALRQGITTHNFKKNRVPLERSPLPLNSALAMKTTFSGLKQNVTVCVTMLVISLIMVFSGVMFENVLKDFKPMIDMIAGESADSCINVNLNREDEFISKLRNDSRVEKYYLFTNNNVEVRHVGGVSLVVSVIDDSSKLNNQSMAIEGRFPKFGNEFAVAAKYAKEKGLAVGDEITLKIGNAEDRYIISGLIQNTNNLGKDCMMTREAFEKISSLPNVSYYIDFVDGVDIDGFNSEMSEYFGSDVNVVYNIYAILEGTSKVYVSLITIIVAAVMILSCIVVIFVMYLLVRTLIGGKKREYGILKALGFTTRQLIFQTAISFMPSVIISTVVGIIVSIRVINPLMALFLGGIGVVKCSFVIPVVFIIFEGIGLAAFAFAAACLMSLRVKKISPRELLCGE